MVRPPFARRRDPNGLGARAATAGAPTPGDEIGRLRVELVRAVARTCPRWLADRADDLVQTALMRVMDAAARREENAQFSALYLRKAAYSAVVDEIRRLRRRREVPLEEEPEHQLVAVEADPERQAVTHELAGAIRGCLKELVEARRRPVTMHLLGHSVGEVAARLRLRAKQAENLVYRGLADLRRCLEARGVRR
jgi:RNA polymerase sigma-70 factor (ECF subfamily)